LTKGSCLGKEWRSSTRIPTTTRPGDDGWFQVQWRGPGHWINTLEPMNKQIHTYITLHYITSHHITLHHITSHYIHSNFDLGHHLEAIPVRNPCGNGLHITGAAPNIIPINCGDIYH
jgi:hypothetical protein